MKIKNTLFANRIINIKLNKTNNLVLKEIDNTITSYRDTFEKFRGAMAYIEVVKPNGDIGIGSAFHIGDGILVTARHVVENCEITKIGTTESYNLPDENGNVYIHNVEGSFRSVVPHDLSIESGPYYHPDSSIDLAVLITKPNDCKTAYLGLYVDDWIYNADFLLKKTVLMGYPPIPFSKEPALFVASAEINAIINKYIGKHIHYIVSAIPRGGFSGGLCLLDNYVLGLIVESLTSDNKDTELGFMSVLSLEPIYKLLIHHNIYPVEQIEHYFKSEEREKFKEAWGRRFHNSIIR